MSIGKLIRRPDLELTARGRNLSDEQRKDFNEMHDDACSGIEEAVAALGVVSDFLLLLDESGNKENLNNASLAVRSLAETIGALSITMADCRFHSQDEEPTA